MNNNFIGIDDSEIGINIYSDKHKVTLPFKKVDLASKIEIDIGKL